MARNSRSRPVDPMWFGRVPRYVLVVALCFCAIVFDGYDLIVYGSVVPALLREPGWDLTVSEVGVIGSLALAGMFVGALLSGSLGDKFGRRRIFVGALALYSTAMLLASIAPSPEWFGLCRAIGGLGFGGVVPVAVALVIEWAPEGRKNFCSAVMTTGFAVGGILAAALSISLLHSHGFRLLFALGGLPLVTLIPLAWWLLPESPRFAAVPGGTAALAKVEQATTRELFRARHAAMVLLFCLANFCAGVVVFGLNTWLPQLMVGAGYHINSAILFQLLLNTGAIAGAVGGSLIADRKGAKPVATGTFLIATICLGVLGSNLPSGLLYALVFIAGIGATGTQIVLFGYVATHFAARIRARAVGVTTGFARLGGIAGPLLGGYLIAWQVGLAVSFLTFAVFALIGAIASVLVPPAKRPADSAPQRENARTVAQQ